MTFQNEYTINIDIKNNIATVNTQPVFVQNDTAILKVKIYNEGLQYDYSNADRYIVNFKRPDGVIVTGSGTYEVATGLIKYTLGSTEMEVKGNVECAISLFLGDTRITTKSFKIKILEDYEHGIPSQEGYSILQELFIEVEQVKTSIQDAAQYATDQGNWAKGIRDNFGHKGVYSPATVYKNGNVVSYGGINYMCIQDTTAGIDPLNGSYWSVVSPQATINQKTWTATTNQTVFTLTNGSYVVGQGNIEVLVGGVPQVSGQGYTETNGTTITLSEGVPVGTTVFAKWFEGTMTITKGHKTGHELGGQDELDVTKLKNFKEQVTDNFMSVNASLADITQQASGKKIKIIACAIRNTGSGFQLINDTEHEPIGVSSITTDSNKITLNYNFVAKQVISLVVTPDEIMAKNGIVVGSSVGTSFSQIFPYKQYSVLGYITKSGGATPNFTVDPILSRGITSVASADSGKTMTITHDNCDLPNYVNGSCVGRNLVATPYISSYGLDTTSVKFLAPVKMFGANISYNGSAFVRGLNQGVSNAVWNATANSLDITLSQAFSNIIPSVTPRSVCGYIPKIYSYDTSTGVIQIRFYNLSNTLITIPDSQMSIIVQGVESYAMDIVPPDGTYIFEKNAFGKIDPTLLTYPGSNFWIYGVMEIE